MKIILILTCVLIAGCSQEKDPDDTFKELKRPIVIVALDKNSILAGSAILRDSCQTLWIASTTNSVVANAITASYNVGDTIK